MSRVYYSTEGMKAVHGDCLEVMRKLPDNSIDSIVTDPPYGLSNTTPKHVLEALTAWISGNREFVPDIHGGFMGKDWDSFVPPPAVWDEALRVLKPGGHLLCFAGTRTIGLMEMSIRLAGFDIRDSIAWLYGSGFPKGQDMGKLIDKAGGNFVNFRDVAEHIRSRRKAANVSVAEMASWFPYKEVTKNWERTDAGQRIPSAADYQVLIERIAASPDLEVRRAAAEREVIFSSSNGIAGGTGMHTGQPQSYGFKADFNVTAPATENAKQWTGWNNALKPAFEPILMAQKPFKGALFRNVLANGVGALNVDASRISTTDHLSGGRASGSVKATDDNWNRPFMDDPEHVAEVATEFQKRVEKAEALGRYPANIILDEDQAVALDNQESGASRFFYCAKASKKERPIVDGVAHPTVKPLALMRYLVRLVTPLGGIVLDPFAGSGATTEAAFLEGFKTVGIERDEIYMPLIQHRIERNLETV